jgi:hypothetical protein
MASKENEQFRTCGLDPPIRIKPGLRSYLFLVMAFPLLLGGSIAAITKGGALAFLVGLIGLPLFAGAMLVWLAVVLRSRRRGLIEFSNRGIHHALYRLDLAWSDIGPAWTYSVRLGGRVQDEVLFILRNASRYKPELGTIERILFAIMERQGRSASGGALDAALMSFTTIFGAGGMGNDTVRALNEMRLRMSNEPDSVVLPIPSLMRPGLSGADTVEIVNTVIAYLARRGLAR